MNYMISLIGAFIITVLSIPIITRISKKYSFTDKPTERKKHRGEIPLSGGLAIYIGFFIMYFLMVNDVNGEKLWVFVGGTLIVLIGLVDDYYKATNREFPIYPRLIVQVLAAILVFRAGIGFHGFSNPFDGQYHVLPPFIQFLLTITWMFGVTTVINWSDGMDGLAGGITLISSCTFFFVAIILGQPPSAVLSAILAGAIGGFLIFNKYPAKIFMGDSGATLLGYILSVIALDGAFKQTTVLSLFIPILALAVPIFDSLFVVLKRFREGKPVYQADRSQMHYRLQEMGLTNKEIVRFILSISLVFSCLSILLLLIKS